MKIIEYAKAHPWTIGLMAVGGVLTFVVVSKAISGGEGGSTVIAASPNGPSESAQLAFAGLQAQQAIASTNANADLTKTSIVADLQKFLGLKDAEVKLAELGSSAQVALSQIAAQQAVALSDITSTQSMFGVQNETSRDVANLQAQIAMYQTQTDYQLESARVKSNESVIGMVLEAMRPQPTPAPTPEPETPRFDPYNTAKRDQPLLQGFDISIAQAIDQGRVMVDQGGFITIPGDSDSAAGSYMALTSTDLRWKDYVPGTFTNTGAVFH